MTTKFNKSVLASAIAATTLLAGSAFAGQLGYQNQTQIVYAKDLFATDSRTIDLPAEFTVRATTAQEFTRLNAIVAGDTIEIVVSLGAGSSSARFQSNAPNMVPAAIASAILIGSQLNAGGAPVALDTLPNFSVVYSNGEREMRIRFDSPGGDTAAAAANYSVQLPTLRLYDLQGALLTGSVVQGGISITNITNPASIVAGNAIFARSAWGEEVATSFNGNPNFNSAITAGQFIDVQRCGPTAAGRVLFTPWFGGTGTDTSAPGTVGTSCPTGSAASANRRFYAGSIDIGLTTANTVGLSGASFSTVINNFDGTAPVPPATNNFWSLISTDITYTVTGSNLTGWNGLQGRPIMWLDANQNCSQAAGQFAPLNVNTAGTSASVTVNVGSSAGFAANLAGLTDGTATLAGTPARLHVCFGANATTELVAQTLAATVRFDHGIPALFVNPPDGGGPLYPLRTNAGQIIFQNVNPAANATAQSFLRLTNNNAFACEVAIDAKDDAGLLSGTVRYTMPAHTSTHFNSDVLETGIDNQGRAITGAFGNGTGRWYVRVSPGCANFNASALNRNAIDGTVTNLTPQKNDTWLTPTTLLNP